MERRYKLSYLILGIGIGILVTSTLYSNFPNVKYVEFTDDIIIEKAKELGMVNLKESINLDNLSNNEKKVKDETVTEKEEYIKFEIIKGETLEDVASNLFNLGIIDNKKEFIQLAEDKTLDKMFNYGVYELKFNLSYSTIIKILTE